MKTITVSKNVLTRFNNLKSHIAGHTAAYNALNTKAFACRDDKKAVSVVIAEMKAINATACDNEAKLERMIKKYGKIDGVTLPREQYFLSLKYPRDGMGRLHLTDDYDFHTYVGGCGFDKRGTALGKWINHYFGDVLQALNDIQLEALGYGVNRHNGRTWCDGGCGESCMFKVLYTLGFDVQVCRDSKGLTIGYAVTKR